MPETIDDLEDLYARWQSNPSDLGFTVRMCDALSESNRTDLVAIVGEAASRRLEIPALVAAARMYVGTSLFDEAQTVLLAAGRLAPRDGEVYRWLGEVLLRRGDAERAEKVLERAVAFGAPAEANQWLDQARSLLALQLTSGANAVAAELAKSRPTKSAPTRKRAGLAIDGDEEDAETQIKKSLELRNALDAAFGTPPSAPHAAAAPVPAAGRLPPPTPPPLAPVQTAGIALPQPGAHAHALGHEQGTMPFGMPPPSGRFEAPPASAPMQPPPSMPRAPGPPVPVNPALIPAPRIGTDGQPLPEARDVLESLQIAGVFEPDGAVRPQGLAWDAPEKGKKRIRSYAILATAAVMLIGGGAGTFYWVKDKRAKAHLLAEDLLAKVDADLHASDAALLEPDEKTIGQTFELDSRSPHAALTWLHERAMVGLLKGGESVSFEDAAQRAKEVGVDEKQVAFAYVASFLFQGDTAGAASVLAKWDGKADDDPWYQLLAGATFERAGDARAIERYNAAAKLDPDLVIAQILRGRATAIDGDARDPAKAVQLAQEFRTKYPTRVEGPALVALAWSRDPMHGDPPPEVKQVIDKGGALPVSLKAVPAAARAIIANEDHKYDEARAALQQGLGLVDTPGTAAWLGSIALQAGDEQLARKAALSAVSFSALYAPARTLAARVALLGARLDEALKAAEDLPPASPDVAVVTAAVAYEKLDSERMQRAFEAMPDEARKLPFLTALDRGRLALGGNPSAVLPTDKALDHADDEAPWSDLVAMDVALDAGDLELADKIAAQWKGDPRPLRALRLARLARYENKLDDADRLSKVALENGTVTTRVLAERVFVLVAMNKSDQALALFKSYPNVGGPSAKFLKAYALGSHGKTEEARAILSQEEPPPALAPLLARTYAAAAYGATKDTKHGNDYLKTLASSGWLNPDIVVAAEKTGAGKLTRKK